MCRSLVEKVGRSELLQAVTEPDVLVLFEDWLEELEREVLSLAERGEKLDVDAVSETLGLSWAGARFLVAKLEREGRI